MAVIAIPRPLREKLGDEGAEALTIAEERFERRLTTVEANIIKWMFIFWVGQGGVITGILSASFRR